MKKKQKNKKKITSVFVKSCKYFYFILLNVHIIFFLVIKLNVDRKNVKERKFNNNSLESPLLGFNLDLCILFQSSKKDKLELLEYLGGISMCRLWCRKGIQKVGYQHKTLQKTCCWFQKCRAFRYKNLYQRIQPSSTGINLLKTNSIS